MHFHRICSIVQLIGLCYAAGSGKDASPYTAQGVQTTFNVTTDKSSGGDDVMGSLVHSCISWNGSAPDTPVISRDTQCVADLLKTMFAAIAGAGTQKTVSSAQSGPKGVQRIDTRSSDGVSLESINEALHKRSPSLQALRIERSQSGLSNGHDVHMNIYANNAGLRIRSNETHVIAGFVDDREHTKRDPTTVLIPTDGIFFSFNQAGGIKVQGSSDAPLSSSYLADLERYAVDFANSGILQSDSWNFVVCSLLGKTRMSGKIVAEVSDLKDNWEGKWEPMDPPKCVEPAKSRALPTAAYN